MIPEIVCAMQTHEQSLSSGKERCRVHGNCCVIEGCLLWTQSNLVAKMQDGVQEIGEDVSEHGLDSAQHSTPRTPIQPPMPHPNAQMHKTADVPQQELTSVCAGMACPDSWVTSYICMMKWLMRVFCMYQTRSCIAWCVIGIPLGTLLRHSLALNAIWTGAPPEPFAPATSYFGSSVLSYRKMVQITTSCCLCASPNRVTLLVWHVVPSFLYSRKNTF